MQNILVTGGAGFIGSNFVRYLLANEPDVHIVNLDVLTYAGSTENFIDLPSPERHTFIEGNITDRALVDLLMRRHQIDTIVHFAAETHVDRSIHFPELFIESNVIGTHTLLQAAKQFWIDESAFPLERVRFHHVSTDEVFGTLAMDEPAFDENTPYDPRSPYSASKAASDHIVRAYFHTYGLPISITNCSNNYGPFQFPEKLIPVMVANAVEGKPLPVYGDGKQIRDWLYVDDHSEAIRRVIQGGTPGETYCVGGDNQPFNIDVIKTLCHILDELRPMSDFVPHEGLIQYVTDRPGHDRRYDIDIRKIKDDLGWAPTVSVEEGMLNTVQWYLEHGDWIDAVRNNPEYQAWIDRNYAKR